MRSDNLKNHVKIHEIAANTQPVEIVGQKRQRSTDNIPTTDRRGFGIDKPETVNQPKNPKIQSLLEEIVNDGTFKKTRTEKAAPLEKTLTPQVIIDEVFPSKTSEKVFPPPSMEILAEVFPQVAAVTFPRTKADIIGYSDKSSEDDSLDTDHDIDEACDSDTESEHSIDIQNIKPSKVKFLPTAVTGLRKRFKKLYNEFMRDKKHENRNELVSILDELLRQEAISHEVYNQVNNFLAESLGEDDEDLEEMVEGSENENENILSNLIQNTTDLIIKDDKDELVDLLKAIKGEAGQEFINTIIKLEELIDAFFTDEFLDGAPILPMIDELRAAIANSPITKLKQQRLKMLIDDISTNRYRVKSILTALNNAKEDKQDIKNALGRLAREELLSEEQFQKIGMLEKSFDLPAIALIIKDTKIGQGINFLPRKMNDLVKYLQLTLEELAETGKSALKNKISGVLDELLRRKAISRDRYNEIKTDNDIM